MRQVRQPRLSLTIDGLAASNVIAAEWRGNGAYQADHFRVDLALRSADDMELVASASSIELFVSLDGGASFTSAIVGQVDQVEIDPISGLARISGRDLSARLIDRQTNEAFANQTSSDVAGLLAERRGLLGVVTPTTALVGRDYGNDRQQVGFGRLAKHRTEWDVLAALAQREGFDVFVQGNALYFQPAIVDVVFVAAWDAEARVANVERLKMHCATALSNGASVTVQSWHSKDGKSVSVSVGDQAATPINLLRANLSESDAQSLAERYAATLSAQAYRIEFEMPGELSLSARSVVQLTGDVGDWARSYRIVEITRRVSIGDGFAQSVSAVGSVGV